jgi:hypothetical protein
MDHAVEVDPSVAQHEPDLQLGLRVVAQRDPGFAVACLGGTRLDHRCDDQAPAAEDDPVQLVRLHLTSDSREHVGMTTGPAWIGAITAGCDDTSAMRAFYKGALGGVDIPGLDQSNRVGGIHWTSASSRTGCGRLGPAATCSGAS